jgi:H+/Cl- antiporter ClcA
MLTTLAIPNGIITPAFIIGSIFGRLFGEILRSFGFNIHPGLFALCGTATFLSAFTKTFAAAIIIIEMTKELDFLIPIFVTLFGSLLVTGVLNVGFFDMIIIFRNLPFLPSILSPEVINWPVEKIMS